MKKVLISPVGLTDPLGSGFDGPLLHIVRHYRPDKIYILFTNAMAKKENETKYIEKHLSFLCRHLNINPEIIYKNMDCDDASNFDFFYIYTDINNEIEKENPGCHLFANITSGSPQMVASMCLDVITHGREIRLIQVKTPQNSANNPHEKENNDYENPENNYDYLEDAANRCVEPKLSLFHDSVFISRFKAYISAYQYGKAKDLIENFLRKSQSFRLKTLCDIGESFLQLDFSQMQRYCNLINYPVPKIQSNFSKIVLALTALEIKLKDRQLMDFAVRITPILFETGKIMIDKFLPEYTIRRKDEDMLRVNTDKLGGTNVTPPPFFAFRHIIEIYQKHFPKNTEMLSLMQELRDIEINLRNMAAHTLRKIEEEDCVKLTGFTPKEIFNKVRAFVTKNIGVDKDISFLDKLNEEIFRELIR